MANESSLNLDKSQYSERKKSFDSVIKELGKLKDEILKNHRGLDKKLGELEAKISKLNEAVLELFLRSIASEYYNKISTNDTENSDLKNGKVMYSLGIDLDLGKNKTITILQSSDIPENFKNNFKIIQEVINFLNGLLVFDNRDYFQAIELLKKIKNPILTSDYYYNQALGLAYLHTKRYELSLSFFDKINTKNKEEEYAAQMNKAAVLRELGRHDEAKATYEEVLSKNPGDGTGLFALGILYRVIGVDLFKKQDYDGALKAFIEASKRLSLSDNIQSKQYAYKSYLNTGTCYYHLGKYESSERVFSDFATNDNLQKYLSPEEIKSVIGGLYHGSRQNPELLKQALKLSEKYFPGYVDHIKGVLDGSKEYKGESIVNNEPIIIKY